MRYRAKVVFNVEIELDESKFDEAFMSEFRKHYYDFDEFKDHVEHLAQLEARDLLVGFVEGYGPIESMGIKGETSDWYVEDSHPIRSALTPIPATE